MQKLEKLLTPEEYAVTINSTELSNTHTRLASQYIPLEQEYRRVILRMEID